MSAFLRRRMRGLLRTTSSAPNSTDAVSSIGAIQGDEAEEEEELLMMLNDRQKCRAGPSSMAAADVYERILNGKNGRKLISAPEVYSGKTGLDLPSIHIDQFSREVKACHTGPDGGLTKVQPIRHRAIAKMVNLDDEEFSLSSMDEDDSEVNSNKRCKSGKRRAKASLGRANSIEALGFCSEDGEGPTASLLTDYDWNSWDEEKAYGLSTSLYEKHPVTGLAAGHPIADVFGIVARENNAILALADGVNWGEGARLAARCAIRGALDHLNVAIERDRLESTNDIFHCLLGSFHAAHALILQEGGALTTLCVALIAPVRDSNSSVLCVCNVGDSLCFVYNDSYGVREVTLASHDIAQMRDMRDAGGALGPVDGRNPQLHNLTCSMSFVEDGDLVFITSDGISDNFDPVVGRFCMIKRPRADSSEKENTDQQQEGGTAPPVADQLTKPPQFFHKTKSAPPANNGLLHFPSPVVSPPLRSLMKRPAAMLPCVDAPERHELMLLRMSDVIMNGLGNHRLRRGDVPPSSAQFTQLQNGHSKVKESPNWSIGGASHSSSKDGQSRQISAAELCRNLVQFSYQLSSAKRRTLEDPELYRTRTHSKTEERLRRKVIRDMIMEMPGKLDHASLVAYRVGKWLPSEQRQTMPECDDGTAILVENTNGQRTEENLANWDNLVAQQEPRQQEEGLLNPDPDEEVKHNNVSATASTCSTIRCDDAFEKFRQQKRHHRQKEEMQRSIIGQQKGSQAIGSNKRSQRHHSRCSDARHTLGVDVSWLKRLVTSKHESPPRRAEAEIGGMATEDEVEVNGNSAEAMGSSNGPIRTASSARYSAAQNTATTSCLSVFDNTSASEKPNGGGANFSLRKLFMRQLPPATELLPKDHRVPNRKCHSNHSPMLPPKPPHSMCNKRSCPTTNGASATTIFAVPRMGMGKLIGGEEDEEEVHLKIGGAPMAPTDDEDISGVGMEAETEGPNSQTARTC